jgi:hypothetical protein
VRLNFLQAEGRYYMKLGNPCFWGRTRLAVPQNRVLDVRGAKLHDDGENCTVRKFIIYLPFI